MTTQSLVVLLLGSFLPQPVYAAWLSVLIHRHVPSRAESVSPVQPDEAVIRVYLYIIRKKILQKVSHTAKFPTIRQQTKLNEYHKMNHLGAQNATKI